MKKLIPALLFCAPMVATCAASQPVRSSASIHSGPGYLAKGEVDVLAIFPPAPTQGDARDSADRRIFAETRALENTERWRLAAQDGEIGPDEALATLSCAIGMQITTADAPRLTAMVNKAMNDMVRAMETMKNHYQRLRPYQVDSGPTCRPTEELAGSFDYPSGHTMYGWTWATILAQALPERSTAILARGRAYGESRYICGVHNYSAVESGWLSASTLLAVAATKPEYQADLQEARRELADLQTTAPKPDQKQCQQTAAAL